MLRSLEDDWPGLDAERDGVTYNEKAIAGCARALRGVIGRFDGTGGDVKDSGVTAGRGSIEDLRSYTSLDELRSQLQSVARWEGGRIFAKAVETGHQELIAVYEEVQKAFDKAIALVDAGAGNYRDAGDANTIEA
ncbi:hypothetical protein ABZ297_07595 [Nonomuraea sp. NPDC005983]|uniref:hypothetical protein n=1 Tax=Nonomuraea sp. NPDC005983 TaxID=3155595 RepID=UPI0033A60BD3